MRNPNVLLDMNGWRQAALGLFLKRRALRRGLTLGLAASLWLVLIPSAQATTTGSTIDVDQHIWNGLYPLTRVTAQTFTAGRTGALDQVRLPMSSPFASSGRVEIRNVDATSLQPTGLALGPTGDIASWSSTAPGTFISPYWVFSFATPISITQGIKYAIVVTLASGSRSWWGENSDAYSGGQSWLGCSGCTTPWLPTSFPADFGFQTYATSSTVTNSAPLIKANTDPVLATEGGTAPTNKGTCSDSDGDTVTLRASTGTVTPTCNGTWTWTGSAADEGTQAITITADDGHGNTTPATFSTQVGSVSPTVQISGAPVSTPEGTTVTLTASATSPSAEDTAAGFKFAWTATENGNALPDGSGPTYSLKSDDEGVYLVNVTATDDGGFSGSASVTITGVDVKPTATITSVSQPFLIVPQEVLTFNGSYADAGSSVDTSYTATWSWGDGSPDTTGGLANLTATHSFPASKTYTVTLTVADDDGVAGSTTTTVTVMTPALAIAKIETTVQGETGLNPGQKNSLLAKLSAAADSYQRGDTGAACNQLNAFVNEVDADQKTGRLTSTDAGTLSDAARVVQRSMGCFSTLVEFLNGL